MTYEEAQNRINNSPLGKINLELYKFGRGAETTGVPTPALKDSLEPLPHFPQATSLVNCQDPAKI